jgi:hypothetical protein
MVVGGWIAKDMAGRRGRAGVSARLPLDMQTHSEFRRSLLEPWRKMSLARVTMKFNAEMK